jgi:hypothetical protein
MPELVVPSYRSALGTVQAIVVDGGVAADPVCTGVDLELKDPGSVRALEQKVPTGLQINDAVDFRVVQVK